MFYLTLLLDKEKIASVIKDTYENEGNGTKEYSLSAIEEDVEVMLQQKSELLSQLGEDGRLYKEISVSQDFALMERELSNFRSELGIRFRAATSVFTLSEWLDNRVKEDKFISFCNLEIKAGMKLAKALTRISKSDEFNFSDQQVDKIHTSYSQILNEKETKGCLIISANPIDFLLMSKGQNWSSCMSIGHEYDSGPLSYAKDKRSLIAFLISSKDKKAFQEGEVVGKKWRKIFILDKEFQTVPALIASKGYPFQSDSLTGEAAEFISDTFFKDAPLNEWCEYSDKNVRPLMSFRREEPGAQLYSDIAPQNGIKFYYNAAFLHSLGVTTEEEAKEKGVVFRFRYGVPISCYGVGCYGRSDAGEQSALCNDCSPFLEYCEDCDSEYPEEEIYYTGYGTTVCEGCYDNYYEIAEDDGEVYLLEDLVFIEDKCAFYTEAWTDRNAFYCEDCNSYYSNESIALTIEGHGSICEDCDEVNRRELEEEEEGKSA